MKTALLLLALFPGRYFCSNQAIHAAAADALRQELPSQRGPDVIANAQAAAIRAQQAVSNVQRQVNAATAAVNTAKMQVSKPVPSANMFVGLMSFAVRSKVVIQCEWKQRGSEALRPLSMIWITKEWGKDLVTIDSVSSKLYGWGKAKIALDRNACNSVMNIPKPQGVICIYDNIVHVETGKLYAQLPQQQVRQGGPQQVQQYGSKILTRGNKYNVMMDCKFV